MDALIAASLAAPLALAALLGFSASRALALRLAPWAPLPALVLALVVREPGGIDLSWLLTGVRLGLDETGRVFLLFSALIWLAAGWFGRAWLAGEARRTRFALFFLLTQAGNLGVCLALDPVGFYFFYALMGFAAYGLVAHDGSAAARRAGRVYLSLAVVGEMLILTGLLLAIGLAPDHPLAAACLILGFGAKTGLPLLHVSLPLAYAAAPLPAAAALAGAMIKAGVLGWMRFLPLGEAALPDTGNALMLAGLVAIFYGSVVGLTQRQPGALLAYSSISQMGYFAVVIGAALVAPALWPLLLPILLIYATQHALAKSALFLGLGVARRRGPTAWVLAGLALPALALAGAPLSSSMLAKLGIKQALAGMPAPWLVALPSLPTLLVFGALGTALLMLRLLWLVRRAPAQADAAPAPLLPWLLTLAGVIGLGAMLVPVALLRQGLQPGALLAASWPIVAALALAFAAVRLRLRVQPIPPGDLLHPLERLFAALLSRFRQLSMPQPSVLPARAPRHPPGLESRLRAWPLAGLLWLLLLGGLLLLLVVY
jgi:formate hydrogenlyase subunit 3/multisubunit Na+/H+ antiporter MnhD subunit